MMVSRCALIVLWLLAWLWCGAAGARLLPKNPRSGIHQDDLDQMLDCQAREVHLALTPHHSSMKVMWRTIGHDCPTRVTYGAKHVSSTLQLEASGSTHEITEDLMCSSPAQRTEFSAVMHELTLTGLDCNTRYWYSIVGDDRSFEFVSPRSVGPRTKFTFLALGDMGESNIKRRKSAMASTTVEAMLHEVQDNNIDFVLHIGDLAYADGSHKVWNSFMEEIEPIASTIPYMVGIGNHEYDYHGSARRDASGERESYHPSWGNFGSDSGGECGAMTAGRFSMPDTPAPTLLSGSDTRPVAPAAAAKRAAAGTANSGFAAAKAAVRAIAATVTNGAGATALWAYLLPMLRRAATDGGGGSAAGAALAAGSGLTPRDAARAQRSGQGGSNAPFWYSYNYGSVHFTVLSTEHDLSEGARQRWWLEADLAAVDRCVTPWLIVALHRPMYVVYPHKDNRQVGQHIRTFIEDLLSSYKVDATIAGHVHSYYRSCAALHERCSEDGVVHVVVGTGGHVLSYAEDDQAVWLDKFIGDWGFGRFTVEPDRLEVEFIRSNDGHVGDRFVLYPQVNVGKECRDGRQGYSATRVVPAQTSQEAADQAALELRWELAAAATASIDHADDRTDLPYDDDEAEAGVMEVGHAG